MNSGPLFALKLLGHPSIEGPGGALLTRRAAQRHRIALLALLARSPGRGLSREKAMAYLWPESDPEHARNLLNVSVYVLRKALGEDALLSSADDLRLNLQAVSVDVAEFEAALLRGEHERAAAAYQGPFMDGFFLSNAPEFERWAELERERLAASYAKALEALAGAAEARRDFATAAEWWKARAAHDAHDSRVARRLMQALEAGGNRAAALHHAEIHERLLQEEFGVEPDPETRAVVDAIRRRRDSHEGTSGGAAAQADQERADPTAHTIGSDAGVGRGARLRTMGRPVGGRLIAWGGGVVAAALVIWGLVAFGSSLGSGRPSVRAENPVASTSLSDRVPPARTIAVLPFVNLSPDPGEEYFSDGLAEELIGTLARIRALQVAARTSSFAFKGQTRDIREIGRALNVATVLEGSVRRDGDRLLVAAQLIDVSDGFHLWSGMYERRLTDIFDIQRDLALQIAGALEAELTRAERQRLARRPTEDPDAHILYLKGRYFFGKRTATSLATAIEYFERALAADPRYAQAHAGLATAYAPVGVHGYLSSAEARERMRNAALRAIEIDPDLAEARTALAAYRHLYEWDWASAETEYRRAIALNPDYPTAHTWYGFLLESMSRFEDAVREIRISVELDPLVASGYSALGFALFLAGHADRGLEHIGHALELDSTNWMAHIHLGQVMEAMGKVDSAIRAYERAVTHSGAAAKPRATLARAWALAGREDEARQTLATLVAEAKATGGHAPVVATAFLALRDVEGAIAWLESAYLQRHPDLQRIPADPRFAALRDDPRFLDLLDRIGLPRPRASEVRR